MAEIPEIEQERVGDSMNEATERADKDFTGLFGQLGCDREWPMYSYERAADSFWNGFSNELLDKGYSESQIQYVLQSKQVRWMLDQKSKEIEDLGRNMARKYPFTNVPVDVDETEA